jgi:hypothetical protein
MSKLNRKSFFLFLLVLGGFLLGSGSIYLYLKAQTINSAKNPDEIEPAEVIKAVSRHIELPESEQPSIAVVRDVKKLQDQEIFRKSKNGDILLIYVGAKRAYLYDPKAEKLVDVAPVNIQSESAPDKVEQ